MNYLFNIWLILQNMKLNEKLGRQGQQVCNNPQDLIEWIKSQANRYMSYSLRDILFAWFFSCESVCIHVCAMCIHVCMFICAWMHIGGCTCLHTEVKGNITCPSSGAAHIFVVETESLTGLELTKYVRLEEGTNAEVEIVSLAQLFLPSMPPLHQLFTLQIPSLASLPHRLSRLPD